VIPAPAGATDPRGRGSFHRLPPGRVAVLATSPGLIEARETTTLVPDATARVRLVLVRPGAARVLVKRATGIPARDEPVELARNDSTSSPRSGTTDSEGVAFFAELRPGDYTVRIREETDVLQIRPGETTEYTVTLAE
jgi:hypothetical protein